MGSGIVAGQLRDLVVAPVLRFIRMWSLSAERLVLGTALVETGDKYLQQLGGGPALGLWQMEPKTHDDIWDSYLKYRSDLAGLVHQLTTPAAITNGANELVGNLFYGAAMCRIRYYRVDAPLPEANDAGALAAYWKDHYNTAQGAGDVDRAREVFASVV